MYKYPAETILNLSRKLELPLNLTGHRLFIFSLDSWKRKVVYENVPIGFEELKTWLPKQKSIFGNDCRIEGIVWHNLKTGEMCKIKLKDFSFD